MSVVKTVFGDAVGPDSVPTSASHGGKTESFPETTDVPGRDGGYLRELHRDGAVTGSPSKSGPVSDSPFKDCVGK